MEYRLAGWLILAVFLGHNFASPLAYHEEGRPLVVVSELGQRLVSHARLQDGGVGGSGGEGRLGLPTPQELDAIKKVAQILVMLGEQVIPTIIADIAPPSPPAPLPHSLYSNCDPAPVEEVPNDPVNDN